MKDECGKCRSTEYITHLTLRPIKVVVYERQSKLCQMAQMKFAAFVAHARGRVRLCGHGRAKKRHLTPRMLAYGGVGGAAKSYIILCYLVLPCLTLSYLVLPYLILSYLIFYFF